MSPITSAAMRPFWERWKSVRRCPITGLVPEAPSGSADGFRSAAAAAYGPIADDLLDAFPGVGLGGVEIAFAVDADLMQPVKLARHTAGVAESAEFLEIAAIQD